MPKKRRPLKLTKRRGVQCTKTQSTSPRSIPCHQWRFQRQHTKRPRQNQQRETSLQSQNQCHRRNRQRQTQTLRQCLTWVPQPQTANFRPARRPKVPKIPNLLPRYLIGQSPNTNATARSLNQRQIILAPVILPSTARQQINKSIQTKQQKRK